MIDFIKFQGFGNDYIVIAAQELLGQTTSGEFARAICDRHYGAGADGIATVSPLHDGSADFHVRIFNPDGSEPALSGNGTRCAAAYLYFQGIWSRTELRLLTQAGVKLYRLLDRPVAGTFWFGSELGKPKFDSAAVPILTPVVMKEVIDYPLQVDDEIVRITALQMGNPNCCVFVDNFAGVNWRKVGRLIESHPQFPERTNVVFARVIDSQNLELRIWERGAGETFASGTCSCAAAVASVMNKKTERNVTVWMPGGRADIVWRTDGEVELTGRADIVYKGEWLPVSTSDGNLTDR